MELAFIALMAIVFAAQVVSAISGFGATVIVLTLGAHLYAIPEILVVVLPLSLLQSLTIAARNHRAIRWRILLTEVLPLMGVGLAVGFLIADAVSGEELRIAFALLVLGLSLRELWLYWRGAGAGAPLPGPIGAGFIGAAGVVHGIWATGGPPLVYALGRRGLDKAAFRSTLCAVWIALDGAYNTRLAATGSFTGDTLRATALLVPAALVGLWLGDRLHARIDERRFRLLTFSLLALSAAALLAS